jgi:two-component system chemotaxis response regulator CheB
MLVVLHVGAHDSVLPKLMSRRSGLDVAHARDDEPLRPRTIRVAPPDRHLMVVDRQLRLWNGPKENFARPAIDPLFRSAAIACGPGAIGVVLTGLLDDGTAGLQAIKARGGIAVVQDPADAEEASMPASALRHVAVDHCAPLRELPALLARLAREDLPAKETAMTPGETGLDHEQALALGAGDHFEHLGAIGTPSAFTCPECHGGLWALKGEVPARYRCHTGHGFTERALAHAIAVASDGTLWNALRTLQERQGIARRMIEHLRSGVGDAVMPHEVARLQDTVVRLERQIVALREVISNPPAALE